MSGVWCKMLSSRVLNRLNILKMLSSCAEQITLRRLMIYGYGMQKVFRDRGYVDVLNMTFVYVRGDVYSKEFASDVSFLNSRGHIATDGSGSLYITDSGRALLAKSERVTDRERFDEIAAYMMECMVNQEESENKILASIPNTGRVNGKPLSEGLYLGIE